MKFILPLLSVSLILAACMPSSEGAPAPQLTPLSPALGEGTGVRETPPPTETPLPTLTPTPVAVDGIAQDAEGNQLAYLNGEWLALPKLDAEYAKLMVDENGVVVAVDAGDAIAYKYDLVTGAWVDSVSVPKEVDIAQHFDIVSTDPVENFVLAGGAVVNGAVLVDRSMKRLGVGEVTMPDSLGAEFLTRIAMTYLNSHGVNGAQVTLGEYQKMLAQVQAQQRSPNDLLVEAHLFDLANPDAGYQPTEFVLWPGEGADLPEGVRAINHVSMMYVRGHETDVNGKIVARNDVPGFKMTDKIAGGGFGAVLNGDTLYILIGPDKFITNHEKNNSWKTASYTLIMYDWIILFDGGGVSISDNDTYDPFELLDKGMKVDR